MERVVRHRRAPDDERLCQQGALARFSLWFARHLQTFRREEEGALLVLFAMCCAAIFLIAALSFDLGKRASTQSELQSFADSVALAAAGELDGRPDAILRAETAASSLIVDSVTFAEGDRVLAGEEDFSLTFYDRMSSNESVWPTPLDTGLESNDRLARYVRVEVTPVQVRWSFARLLNVFSSAALPSEDVVASATAGYTGLACDIPGVFFCMPDPVAGVDAEGFWDPANHIGTTLRLRTTSGDTSNWGPGSMGFIDVSRRVDTASTCDGATGTGLFNCLLNVSANRSACVENGSLLLQDGRVNGISDWFFNTRMDVYEGGFTSLRGNPEFPTAPIVTKPYAAGSTCGPGGGTTVDDATDFLPDDCFVSGGCTSFGGEVRFGDGDWSDARLEYVDRNYSTDPATIGSVEAVEVVSILGIEYHIDDPFRPGDATTPRRSEYSSYPIVSAGHSRWNYYNAEVAAAYFDTPAAAYVGGEVDISGVSSGLRSTPIDLLEVTDTDGVSIPRAGSSLPQCAASNNTTLDPRRRTFLAGAVDCSTAPLNGAARGRAEWFVELFVLDVADGPGPGELFFSTEFIRPDRLNTGRSFANGTFRTIVQLYR